MQSWMREPDVDRARSRNTFQLEPRFAAPGGNRGGRGSLLELVTARRAIIAAVVIGLFVALVAVGGDASDAETTSPDDLAADVAAAQARAGLSGVDVRMDGFTVVLEGEVATETERVAAERVARSHVDVIAVDNLLTVPASDEEPLSPAAAAAAASPEDLVLQNRLSTIAALSPVQFESASDVIVEESLSTLDELALAIQAAPSGVEISIQGHTDSDGEPDANLDLSQRRADAVKAYLVAQGVDESALSTVGLGDTAPVADNETQLGKSKNRRIEFLVVPG